MEKITSFYNQCHADDGRFCDNMWHRALATKGLDAPTSGHRAYWLSYDGKFVPFNTHLDAIQKENVSGEQELKAKQAVFARKERAVRLSIQASSADVEIWAPMSDDQISAIESSLKRDMVTIASHNQHIPDDPERRYYPLHGQSLLKPTTEELDRALEIANMHVRGRNISEVASYLSEEELHVFRMNAYRHGRR